MASNKAKTPAKAHGGDIRGFFAKGSSQTASGSSQTPSQKSNSVVSTLKSSSPNARLSVLQRRTNGTAQSAAIEISESVLLRWL